MVADNQATAIGRSLGDSSFADFFLKPFSPLHCPCLLTLGQAQLPRARKCIPDAVADCRKAQPHDC